MPQRFASRNGLRGSTKRRVPIDEARRRARQGHVFVRIYMHSPCPPYATGDRKLCELLP